MADLARKTASIYINHAPAEEALKKLQTQADKLSENIKKGEASGKSMVNELKKLNTVKDQIAGVQRQIDSGLKPSFNQLQSIVAKTRAELKKMSESDDGFKQKAKDLEKYQKELSRLGTQIGAVKKESGGIGSMIGGLLPGFGALAAGAAITGFLKGAQDEALNADRALNQLRGTLENIGRGGGEDLERLAQKAENVATRFKYLDSADVVDVFNKLISYGKLTEAQMDKLTPVIVNFAAKTNVSLEESTSVIIKALEGNGKALKEYGIDIKDAKTDTERLAVVMGELGDKVNGAADAFGESIQGNIATTRQRVKDLQAEIGDGLMPVMAGALQMVQDVIVGIKAAFTSSAQAIKNLKALQEKNVVDFAEKIGTEMGQKSIADQQRLADGYKSIYLTSQKALSDFMKSSDKDNIKERNRLLANQEQDEKIYLATQRTLLDAIATQKKNSEKKSGEESKKGNDAAERARLAALKKAQEDALRLQKVWDEFSKRIYDPSALDQNDPVSLAFKKVRDQAEKDAAIAKELLDKKTINYKQYSEALLRIEEIRLKAFRDLAKKYNVQSGDAKFVPGQAQSMVKPIVAKTISTDYQKDLKRVEADQARTFRNDMASAEISAIVSTGKKKLDAELNLMDFQKAKELSNKDLTENEKLLIEEKYRAKRKDAEVSFQQDTAQTILEVAQQVSQIMSMFGDAQKAADEAKLADNQRAYDEDKNKLEKQLRQKLVSQKEYDRQVRALDEKKRKEDAAIKSRQFERDKRAQIIQAIMAGAGAVINAMKAPPPLNFIFAGLATAMVAAQVATIASQKAPQFAKGGLLDGPSHKAGGMPVLNKHGKKVAEVEGGEAILSKKTVRNNWDMVSALLNSSMYNNGARLIPYNQTRSSYSPMNYSGVSKSMQRVRYFEKGGITPNSSTTTTNNEAAPGMDMAFMEDLYRVLESINKKLDEPFRGYVVLSELNAAQEQMNRILKETTIRK